jgi:hypothetical protein
MKSKGYPMKKNFDFNVPANANYEKVLLDAIPAGETWYITSLGTNTPAGITLSDVAINNMPIGLYVGPSSYGEFRVLDFYGEPLPVGAGQLSINTVSSVASITPITLTIYAFVSKN